jgi:hypothetical protein
MKLWQNMKVIYIADAKDAELSLKFINKKRGGVKPTYYYYY